MLIILGGVFDEKESLFITEEIIPELPLTKNYYKCDSSFHLDFLLEMQKKRHTEGLINITGSETLFYSITDLHETVLSRIKTKLPSNHCRGGQSQNRIARLRDIAIHDYLTSISERAIDLFTENGLSKVNTLIVMGNGEMKDKLKNYLGLLKPVCKFIVTDGIVTLASFRQEINDLIKPPEDPCIDSFIESFNKNESDIVYGKDSTLDNLELVKDLIIHCDYKEMYKIKSNTNIIYTENDMIKNLGGICGILYYSFDTDFETNNTTEVNEKEYKLDLNEISDFI